VILSPHSIAQGGHSSRLNVLEVAAQICIAQSASLLPPSKPKNFIH